MMKKTCFLSLALVASLMCAKAQVTIGSQDDPNANAVLDLQTNDKGLLLPRVALVNIYKADPLEEHVAGMIVYNTATDDDIEPGLYYNDGSKWKLIRSVAKRVEIAGLTFMDRNLGADPDAESVPDIYDPGTDTAPIGKLNGDYYQWGRVADGHQRWNSAVVKGPIEEEDAIGQIPTTSPAYGKFIVSGGYWKKVADNHLWDADGGKANPCPEGYRIPTSAEWKKVSDLKELAWSYKALGLTLGTNFFLPAAGRRNANNQTFQKVRLNGFYWSATAAHSSIGAYLFEFDFTTPNGKIGNYLSQVHGMSVRCIKK